MLHAAIKIDAIAAIPVVNQKPWRSPIPRAAFDDLLAPTLPSDAALPRRGGSLYWQAQSRRSFNYPQVIVFFEESVRAKNANQMNRL
jgi:hypothetical protein